MPAGIPYAGCVPAGFMPYVASTTATPGTFDEADTVAVSSVEIDPLTKDVVVGSDGNEEGMTDSAQRVYILTRNTLGSRANFPEEGLEKPKGLDSSTERFVDSAFRRALQPVLDDGTIRIESITVETEGTVCYAEVRWVDLKTQIPGTTRQPLGF